jgi:hypothetical protein
MYIIFFCKCRNNNRILLHSSCLLAYKISRINRKFDHDLSKTNLSLKYRFKMLVEKTDRLPNIRIQKLQDYMTEIEDALNAFDGLNSG